MTSFPLSSALNLTDIVAKATLLLVLGWCGAWLLRRAAAGARHLAWLIVIIGVLLIPIVARVAPVPVAVLPSAGSAPVVADLFQHLPALAVPTHQATRLDIPALRGVSPVPTPNYATLAIALWLAVAAALVGWLLMGMLSVSWLLRDSRALDSADRMRALHDVARRLNLGVVPRLVVSDRVEMAFVCNAFAPTIVFPASAEGWSADRRRAVLLHEMAHLARRDLMGHAVARVACAIYWFHPLVWVAARRLRAESEQACDDLVLGNGVRASDYAQHLLDLVTNLGHGRGIPAGALPMVRRTEFEGRVVAILDGPNRRRTVGRPQFWMLTGIGALLATSIAAAVPVSRERAVSVSVPSTAAASVARHEAPPAQYVAGDRPTLAGLWKFHGSQCRPACESWMTADTAFRLAIDVRGDTVIVATEHAEVLGPGFVVVDTIIADGRRRAVGTAGYPGRTAHWLPHHQGLVEMIGQLGAPVRQDDWTVAPDGGTLWMDANVCMPGGFHGVPKADPNLPPRLWCRFIRPTDGAR